MALPWWQHHKHCLGIIIIINRKNSVLDPWDDLALCPTDGGGSLSCLPIGRYLVGLGHQLNGVLVSVTTTFRWQVFVFIIESSLPVAKSQSRRRWEEGWSIPWVGRDSRPSVVDSETAAGHAAMCWQTQKHERTLRLFVIIVVAAFQVRGRSKPCWIVVVVCHISTHCARLHRLSCRVSLQLGWFSNCTKVERFYTAPFINLENLQESFNGDDFVGNLPFQRTSNVKIMKETWI